MNFAAFDLTLLRVFDALMRERSAPRAGERVGLSQPALSATLRRLGQHLDDKLFVRQRNEMTPAPHSEQLATGIQDSLEVLQQLLAGPCAFVPRLVRTRDPAHSFLRNFVFEFCEPFRQTKAVKAGERDGAAE